MFERVLVGFDGSPTARTALELAKRLHAANGELVSLTVAEAHYAMHAGMDAVVWDKTIHARADQARSTAEALLADVDGASATVVTGHVARSLLAEAQAMHSDLIAVGSHGHGRIAGLVLGSVVTRIIHAAPCSVLVARGTARAPGFPRSIVVGIDTSAASAEAAAVAAEIGASTGAGVRHLTASGGKRLPDDAVPPADVDARAPVEALVAAGRSSDLLVVGSRGRHGLAAVGNVGARLARQAPCSVLIVRAVGTPTGSSAASPDPNAAHRRLNQSRTPAGLSIVKSTGSRARQWRSTRPA